MTSSPVNFLRGYSQPGLGWIAMALGVSLLAAAVSLALRWSNEGSDYRTAYQASIAKQDRLRVPPPRLQPTMAELRWRQSIAETGRPWLSVLRAIESATKEPIYLLSLSVDPTSGGVLLSGEAPDFDRALDYVKSLEADPAMRSAMLVSHEQISGVDGQSVVRFTSIGKWAVR